MDFVGKRAVQAFVKDHDPIVLLPDININPFAFPRGNRNRSHERQAGAALFKRGISIERVKIAAVRTIKPCFAIAARVASISSWFDELLSKCSVIDCSNRQPAGHAADGRFRPVLSAVNA